MQQAWGSHPQNMHSRFLHRLALLQALTLAVKVPLFAVLMRMRLGLRESMPVTCA